MTQEFNQPLTEDDIANYLVTTPDFFDRHAQLLAEIQLISPHSQRAVSLQERQAEMLREKIKAMESRIMDMVRHANDNSILNEKLLSWVQDLLLFGDLDQLPKYMCRTIERRFSVPQAVIKLWDVADEMGHAKFVQDVTEDAKLFTSSLSEPFVGVNAGFDVVGWLAEPEAAKSVALIPLCFKAEQNNSPNVFGLIVLASPDEQRFTSGMSNDFLKQLAKIAGAALSRLP